MARLLKIKHKTGDVIAGRYKVVGMLGKPGGMATVYKVYDEEIDVFYACKEMDIMDDPTTAENEREIWMENFKREAQVLARLHNEHIPSAHFVMDSSVNLACPECGETFKGTPVSPCHSKKPVVIKERYYLMMHLIEGKNLEEIGQGHPLEEEKVLEWTMQLCTALKSLHNRNLLHRDVKPENIMIDDNGKAFLVDLGLVKVEAKKLLGTYGTREMSKTGTFGTPGYAPPEQAKGKELDSRTDIYALGMTMYRVLTRKDPKNQNELFQMLDNSPRFLNTNISEETDTLILQAIQQNPKNRYESIDGMLGDIRKIIGEGEEAQPAGTPALEVDSKHMSFRNVKIGASQSKSFTVSNIGGGSLRGVLNVSQLWIKVPDSIDPARHRQQVTVTVDSTGLMPGFAGTGFIELRTNAGNFQITVEFTTEGHDIALKNFQNGLFWVSAVSGGSLGYLFGHFLGGGGAALLFFVFFAAFVYSLVRWRSHIHGGEWFGIFVGFFVLLGLAALIDRVPGAMGATYGIIASGLFSQAFSERLFAYQCSNVVSGAASSTAIVDFKRNIVQSLAIVTVVIMAVASIIAQSTAMIITVVIAMAIALILAKGLEQR